MNAPAPRHRGTRIEEAPTFQGRGGKCWRVRLPPVGQRFRPDWDATVGCFIVHVPGAHIAWDHWFVSVVHLRPIEGVKPAFVRAAGLTHEFVIASIDPDSPLPPPVVSGPNWGPRFLTPLDVVEQFTTANDAVADEILELAVLAIVGGQASPDSDWRAWWKDSIARTAQHFADGTHSVGGLQ